MNHSKNLNLPKLYLASASPRRRQLLESLGFAFQVVTPQDNEISASVGDVLEIARQNAQTKATSVLEHISEPQGISIGADTLVATETQVLGKPKNIGEIVASLRKLSGAKHRVITGLALHSKAFGLRTLSVSTDVWFRPLDSLEIEQYAKTKEPLDKAGAYAIQGLASLFIEKIEGSYTNIVGFPIEAFLRELESLTKIPIYRWFE